ncbi:MAG: hypothetical protein K6E99_04330 [Bacilli bacterium]|nr:hypothetical protein [Bacilli bacterium]
MNIKKEELAKKLGAKKFQKLVYKVESIKYSLLKNQLSFLLPLVEKSMKKRRNNLINNTNDPIKQDLIDNDYKRNLILFRKELNQEKNRNYHFDVDYSKNFKDYLLWNKKVHLKGIAKNVILIVLSLSLLVISQGLLFNVGVVLGIINSLGLVINFECVNLQNYHLSRYEKVEDKLEERKKETLLQKNKKYSNAINAINKQIEQSNELPKLDVRSMQIEELKELKQLLLEVNSSNKKLERRR